MSEFDFSQAVEVVVEVVTPEGKQCLLKEASGESVIRYRSIILEGMKIDDGKIGGDIKNLSAGDALLVHLCLFYVAEDDTAT